MTFINNTFDTVDDEELAVALALKSDKLTTYTKSQVDSSFQPTGDYASTTALNTKQGKPPENETFAYQSDVDTKANTADVDTSLGLKANTTDVNTALALKANTTDVDTSLALKANTTDVNTALALKANTTDVDTALALKANTTDVDTSLALKANTTDVDTSLALKANTTDVNTALALKANTTDVNTSLALKANTTDVDTSLALKADKTVVDDHTTRIVSLETTDGSHGTSIQALNDADYAPKSWVNDKGYATESYVDGQVVKTSAINILIGAAVSTGITAFKTAYVDVSVNAKNALQDAHSEATYVQYPFDWSNYPPLNSSGVSTGEDPTLKSYTDRKIMDISGLRIDDFKNGISSYLKLRDYSVDGNNNRTGIQRLEFLRTTPLESFGENECVDWRLTTSSTCGFNIYRKGTHPTLGVVYAGNVFECDQDGDVNIPKVGGLKINGNEVATKSYTDTTFAAIGVEASVSQLATTSTDHGGRITTIEGAGYVTSSTLGTNHYTKSETDTAIPDVSNFVTSSTLSTNHYTKSETDTAIPDVSNFVTSTTLGTNHYTKSETDSAIPDVSNFVTSTTLGTNHYTKTETDTAITNAGGGDSILDADNNLDLTAGYNQDTTNKSSQIIFNDGGSNNIDAIYYDDATNRYHFTTDTTKYANGNAGIECGSVKCDTIHFAEGSGTVAKIVKNGNQIDLYSDNLVRFLESDANAAKVVFDLNNGFVGINNTAPNKDLIISGETSFSVDVRTAGHVIVGNDSSSGHALDLISMGSININLDSNDNDTTKVIDFRKNTKTDGGSLLMRIKEDGNVGINTTSPGYKLDVNGTARVAGQMAWTGTGSTSYANYGGNRDWYIRSGSSSGKVILQDTGGNVGVGRSPSMRLDVAGTLRCEEMFFGNYDDTYNPSSLSCTKTRRSTGDPQIQFTINGVTGLGWIPFTFSLFGSGVNSNGGSHFQRATNGHGRFYNSSNSTTGTSGVTFTAINTSGNKAILTWTMDDVGRTYSVFSVTLNCYTGVIS